MRCTSFSIMVAASLWLASALQPLSALEATERLEAQVRAAEAAFARTMADRDYAAFTRYIATDAVFASARQILRGRAAVSAGWKPYFTGPQAPFAWAPDVVAVVAGGRLALSSGPVFDAAGKRTGSFKSTWRLDADGQWRVVIDSGCPVCDCDASAP